MDMVFLQNGRIFPGVHKIGAAISAPRIADKNCTRIFLKIARCERVDSLAMLLLQFDLRCGCPRCQMSSDVGGAMRATQSGQVRPPQGTEICNFGAPSPLQALHWTFCFFSSIYVQFSKTSPLKSGESSEKSSG